MHTHVLISSQCSQHHDVSMHSRIEVLLSVVIIYTCLTFNSSFHKVSYIPLHLVVPLYHSYSVGFELLLRYSVIKLGCRSTELLLLKSLILCLLYLLWWKFLVFYDTDRWWLHFLFILILMWRSSPLIKEKGT